MVTENQLEQFKAMALAGETPEQVCSVLKSDGFGGIEQIKILRLVFKLSLAEAKEVSIVSQGLAKSLSEYQERFIPAIQLLIQVEEKEEQLGRRLTDDEISAL